MKKVVLLLVVSVAFSCNFTSKQGEDFNPFGVNPIDSYELYDITKYAEDPNHERNIRKILRKMPLMTNVNDIRRYILGKAPSSRITGEMVLKASVTYRTSAYMILAIMQMDSQFGTKGLGARSKNPGNVGTYNKRVRRYSSWQDGVHAVAHWLSQKKKQRAGTQACRPFTFISQKSSQNLFYQTLESFLFLFRYFLLSLRLFSFLLLLQLSVFLQIHCSMEENYF